MKYNTAMDANTSCPNAQHMGDHACSNKAQCWEPCGELGHSEAHVRVGRESVKVIKQLGRRQRKVALPEETKLINDDFEGSTCD
jgi:hypothetical protein